MAVEPPDVDTFDRDDLVLSPEAHQEQAKMAATRGEDYDPHEYERRVSESTADIDPIEDAEAVEGKEDLFGEWQAGE